MKRKNKQNRKRRSAHLNREAALDRMQGSEILPSTLPSQEKRTYEDDIRDLLQQENLVVNNRIGWMLAVEGLLFAGFGSLFQKFTEGDQTKIKFILLGIAGGGILIGLLNLAALVASSNATYRLHKWWEDNRPTDYSGPGVVGWSLKPTSRWPHLLVVWNFLPVVICGVWTYILFMGGFW